jgi:hypothetical protein
MGSLILAGAIKNKLCELDQTSTWYHIAGPLLGTKISTFAKEVCEKRRSVLPQVHHYIATVFGYCMPGKDQVRHNNLKKVLSIL